MEEFLNKLYSYENFGIYLIISIVVLIILFFVILFFGKKDKKEREIEATKKLQQINSDAFKDDSIVETVEVNNNLVEENNINEQIVESNEISNDNIEIEEPVVMNIEENNSSDFEIPEPVLPVIEEPINEINQIEIEETVIEEQTPEIKLENFEFEQSVEEEITPILDKVEEKPLVFNDFTEEIKIPIIEQVNEKDIEPVVTDEIEVPTFNFDEIVKEVEETKKVETNYTRGPQIFSSVYVPEKEPVKEEETIVEMPEVKEIPKAEDDFDFELPALKKEDKKEEIEQPKEEKIEMPILNDYNLDNLSGETYEIK